MRPVVLLALCVLITPLFAPPAQASDELDRFFASDFTWCDAKVLAAHWGQDVSEAKARIGRKIGWGDVDSVLRPMRTQAGIEAAGDPSRQCQFWETTFSASDAQLLASAWNMSRAEAKAALARKASVVGEAAVRRELLSGLSGSTHQGSPAGTLDTCHNKLLRHLWGTDSAQVQATVQRKIGMGQKRYIDSELDEARKLARLSDRVACSFWDTPYTYADAELLAGRWGRTVSQAKAHIELKYKNGLEDWVGSELSAARGQ